MDINYCIKLWEKDTNSKLSNEQFWDSRAEEFNKDIYKDESVKKLMDFLVDKNLIRNESEILDIGCGPGRYSMEMSRLSKNVIGIDISEKMLSFANDNIKKNNIDNVKFYKSYWNEKDTNIEGKYDLVFASMCPGINNYDDLMKMVEYSKKSCFMSGFIKREDSILNKIETALQYEKNKNNRKIFCGFNILFLLGYNPKIQYIGNNWSKTVSVEQIYDEYLMRLKLNKKINDLDKDKIYKVIKDASIDNYVTENISSTVGWIYWDVNKGEE